MDSLSSLVKTLSPMFPASVYSGNAAQQAASVLIFTPSPAFSVSHPTSILSKHSPDVMVTGGMARELTVPPARVNIPESYMKEIMQCEMFPLGYHLSLAVKER